MARIDRTAFAKALHEAHEREHDQRGQDATDVYADLLASLGPSADPERRAMRAIALMRRGNALMELRRWDEARGALDEALHDAKASGDRVLRPRGDEGESGATPGDSRKENRVIEQDAAKRAPTFEVGPRHGTGPWPRSRSTCNSSGSPTIGSPRSRASPSTRAKARSS